jgi:hypothetical protein
MPTASAANPVSKAVFILAAASVVGLVWARAALTLHDVTPVPPVVHPTAVVWSDRVFARRAPFERWLSSRGRDYGAWAAKHPAAAQRLASD